MPKIVIEFLSEDHVTVKGTIPDVLERLQQATMDRNPPFAAFKRARDDRAVYLNAALVQAVWQGAK